MQGESLENKNEQTVAELVGAQIKKIREERDYTLEQLSRIVRLPVQALSDIESGTNSVNLDELVSIINALRCSSDDVFYDVINYKSIINNRYLDERLRGTYWQEDVFAYLDSAMAIINGHKK